MKKLIFFATLCLCLSANSQNLAEQLIRIHNVEDSAAMVAIINPEQRSLVYVVNPIIQILGGQRVFTNNQY